MVFRPRCKMHQVGFSRKWKVFSMNEMHTEPPFTCDYVTSRNGYCKRKFLKITNCSKNDERTMYLCFYLIWHIYNSFKYPVRGQKLLGSARSGSTTLSYWNCVFNPGWWLMKAVYNTCFHMLYDEKKKSFKNNIYI